MARERLQVSGTCLTRRPCGSLSDKTHTQVAQFSLQAEKKFNTTTNSNHELTVVENLINQNFVTEAHSRYELRT